MFKIKYNSPVILTYALICIAALALDSFVRGDWNYFFFSVYRFRADDFLGYLRLFTHIIGHINFEHLFGNFTIILLVGPMLEEKYSSSKILIMIIFTAFITGIIHILFSDAILLGASGIAFMFIILSSFANIEKGRIPLTLIVVLIMYIGQEIVNGFSNADNISQLTHIIGGFCGAVFGFIFTNQAKPPVKPAKTVKPIKAGKAYDENIKEDL